MCMQDEGAGDAQLINSVYLDNSSMELYHGRLDKKPNALAIRIRLVKLLLQASAHPQSLFWCEFGADSDFGYFVDSLVL